MYDMSTPGGASLQRRGDAYRIVLGNSKPAQIAVVILWLIGSVVWWLAVYRPDVLPFRIEMVPRAYAGWIWLTVTAVIWYVTVRHTVITIANGNMVVVYRPFCLPPTKRLNMANIIHFDIDTIIRTHRDKHGRERETYTFRVQASLQDDWHPPVIFSTSNEASAVWLRHTLENIREMLSTER